MQSVAVGLTEIILADPHCSDLTLAVYSMICFTLSLLLCAAQQWHKRPTACRITKTELLETIASAQYSLTVLLQLQLYTHATAQHST
jgi:hypothetical protein